MDPYIIEERIAGQLTLQSNSEVKSGCPGNVNRWVEDSP
jgi:hypothetical protein